MPEPVGNKIILVMEGKEDKIFVTYEAPDGVRRTICVNDDGSFDKYKTKGPESSEGK